MPDGGRAAGLFALFSLFAFSANAQLPPQISIEWTGSPLCQRSAGLDAEVARLLGPEPVRVEPTQFVARVDELTERTLNYYRLTLSVSSETRRAERSVELATCGDVQDAAALLIATAIDPNAALRASAPAPEKPPEKPAEPLPQPPEEAEPVAPLALPRWSLRAQGWFDLQSLPEPTFGVGLGALMQQGRYRAWAEARYLFPRTAPDKDMPDLDFETEVDLWAAGLGGAFVWPFRSFVAGPAFELELGALSARGTNSESVEASSDASVWVSALLGVVAAYPVHRRVGLELGLFAGLPIRLAQLTVGEGAPPFYTTERVTMRLALGLRVSLGSP